MAVTLKPVSKISGSFGQEGEEKVAQLLEEELPEQYIILNSPRVAHNNNVVDIDHLLITPTAIFVIECKNMNGKISGGLMGNWVQERFNDGRKEFIKIGNPASQVNQYAKVVRDFVRAKYTELYGSQKNFKVEPIVVFSHPQSNLTGMHFTSRGKIGKVHVVMLKDVIQMITSMKADHMTQEEIEQCADILVPSDQRDQTGVFPVLAELPRENFRNRFQILEEIGRGSYSTVYRAFDNKLDLEVAVKKLDQIQKRDNLVERFTREARITAKLNHRNIVRFYDYYEDNGDFYLVMELVEGLTLQEVLEEGAFSLREVAEVYPAILAAIQYAHENNVVHRDLKAANILLTQDRVVKVTDFGVARLLDESELTQTKASIGTPANMAPEQVMGEQGDHKVDIFALGVLLYQMLTGLLPFRGESLGEIVNNILREEPEVPSYFRKTIPRDLDWVVLKALEKDPVRRYHSVNDLTTAFQGAVNLDKLEALESFGGNRGVLANFYIAGHSWLRYWKDDRRKFYTVALLTVLLFGWMISLQLYADSRMSRDNQNSLRPGQINVLIPQQNSKLISNDNLKEVYNKLLSMTGMEVKLTGIINQVVERKEDRVILELAVKPTGKNENIRVLLSFQGDPHILLNKRGIVTDVQVIGVMGKMSVLDRETNSMVEVPLVVAQRMEALEPWNVMAPAKFQLNTMQTIDRNGKIVTLSKIEFSDTETRLFVAVKNNSLKRVFISLTKPTGIQGGKTIPQLYNLENNYQMELDPGKEVSGILVIGPINLLTGNAEFKLGNDLFGEEPWTFKVKW
ncbi:MAG: protein kinase [Carboxydocellales bacterium]